MVDTWTNAQLKAGTDSVVMLQVNGSAVTLTQGAVSLSFSFAQRLDSQGGRHGINEGLVGIGTMAGAGAQIDDVVVQAAPALVTLDKSVDFSAASPASGLFNTATAGTWTTTADGRFLGVTATATAPAVDLIGKPVTPGSLLTIATTLKTAGQGGIVFDYQGANYYKFVTLSADAKQLVIGHVTGAATVIDKTYAATVSGSTDYNLGVTLRGGLVNVSLNGAVVLSNLYNETVTAGDYGLISIKGATSGQTSFDSVRVRTDDAHYATPALLVATQPAPAADAGAATLTQGQLQPVAGAALARWSLVKDEAFMAALAQVDIQVADLPGLELGEYRDGVVYIDRDAAGYGWFVDATPATDREYRLTEGLLSADQGPAAGHMDLVSVVLHELGHAGGLEHEDRGVMAEALAAGTRTLRADDAVSAVAALPPGAVQSAVMSAPAGWGLIPTAPQDAAPGSTDLGANLSGPGLAAADQARAATPQPGYRRPVGDGVWLPPAAAARTRATATAPASPVIDWEGALTQTPRRSIPAVGPSWMGDFVNHLGRTQGERNPNASLRVYLPAVDEVTPTAELL